MKFSRVLACLLIIVMMLTVTVSASTVQTMTGTDAINQYLNEDTDLGEGSKANPVAVIPIQHVDGPLDESDFVAFVNFKYLARDFVKYQVTYISCTCRPAAYNYWTTVYFEMTLPESGLLDDAVLKTMSFERDPDDSYDVGFWGDSDPIPSGMTYEQIRDEYVSWFVGQTYGDLKDLNFITDIDPASYSEGKGRTDYSIDAFTGATVSTNNIIRVINAAFKYHGTDEFFANDPSLAVEVDAEEAVDEAAAAEPGDEGEPAGEAIVRTELPPPRDLTKTYKANPEDTEEVPATEDCYLLACSSITADNLVDYLNRDDVLYIDVRNYEDYLMKHFRNFEVIPYFALIFDAEAHTDSTKVQLYGGSPKEPIPVYEESDKMLELMFPKDKTIFLLCQSGGRVAMLMDIMAARGWDMSKVYNIGGMAQYTGSEYRPFIVDTMEFGLTPIYTVNGLTRVAP